MTTGAGATCGEPPARTGVVLTLAVVAIVLGGVGWNAVWRATYADPAPSDFPIFYGAGQALAAGGDIYAAEHRGWHFFYPPFAAVLFAGIAWLPEVGAASVWYVINVGALALLFARLVLLADGLSGRELGVWVTAAVLINFGPLFSGILRLQVSLLLAALMVEALWSYRRGRSFGAGLWIALAAAIKVYPAVLALPLVVRRDWRGIGGLVAGTVVAWVLVPAVVCGPARARELTERFVGGVAAPAATDTPKARPKNLRALGNFAFNDQSVFSVGGRWLARGSVPESQRLSYAVADWPVERVQLFARLVALLTLVLLVWACATRAGPRDGWREAVLWTLVMTGAHAMLPVVWHHYYVANSALLALGFAMWRCGVLSRARWLLGVALLVAIAGNWLYVGVYPLRGAGLLLLSQLPLWALLWAWVVRATPRESSG